MLNLILFINFNSIKVRLKPPNAPEIRPYNAFQFHKGTIKTDLSHRHMFTAQPFQFHKGTIKTVFFNREYRYVATFQFHKGTIKT